MQANRLLGNVKLVGKEMHELKDADGKTALYWTVPEEEEKTFTVINDVYKRTTWACDGWKSSGELKMLSQVRLVFTPCGRIPLRKVWRWYRWADASGDHEFVAEYLMPNFGEPTMEKVWYYQEYSFMKWEKLMDPLIEWGLACEADGTCLFEWSPDGEHWYWLDKFAPGWHSMGHYSLWLPFKLSVAWRSYKGPVGLWWRYQY